ncbi:MAG TPA: RDD family protein [Vicinamibacterales bacterium]|nr:RDD family protein [Vicinamibacterales bacterium]
MKCPKCEYLGFDTGDRCRNCGYDFSLIVAAPPEPAGELSLHTESSDAPVDWLSDLEAMAADAQAATVAASAPEVARRKDAPLTESRPAPLAASAAMTAAPVAPVAVVPVPAASSIVPAFDVPEPPLAFRGEPALPLFSSESGDDDEPLIKLPSQPRPPLAVRRTPETPRLRAVARGTQRPAGPGDPLKLGERLAEPQLDFLPETAPAMPRGTSRHADARTLSPRDELTTSTAGPRLMAAAIDHAILAVIDVIVLYLTLRIAQLELADIRNLPILPMGAFLGLLKLAYFAAFTCVGGQTIGKMAAGIRVVGDDQRALDAPHAIHRALAGAISFLTFGLGFVPALLGSDHRALHDRLAHTRVVVLPGA